MPPKLINRILIERYRVDEFIAAGGMGAVYRVYDLERSAPLAMKILHDDLADDPAFVRRFQREATNLENLTHPNIVPFYGLVQTDEFVFLLQAYIDGSNLKELLDERKGKPFTPQESLVWIKSLQAALGYAHRNHVIHCDLKPGNVMIDRGGRIYLTDFGISREYGGATSTLVYAGSPGYMPPEQIRGEKLTPATDVYALGVLLFELLTGTRPFLGNEPGSEQAGDTTHQRILYAHLHLPPPDPRSRNPSLPVSLSPLIAKALAKDPAQRHPSTQAFYHDLLQALGVDPAQVADRWFLPAPVKADAAATLQEISPEIPRPTVLETPPASSKVEEAVQKTPRGGIYLAAGAFALVVLFVLGWLGWNWLSQFATTQQPDNTQPVTAQEVSFGEGGPESKALEPGAAEPVNGESTATFATETPMTGLNLAGVDDAAAPGDTPSPSNTPPPADNPPPTDTPELSEKDPRQAQPVYKPIANCVASRLKPGVWSYVSFGGGQNAIRSDPDLHASENWIGVAKEGDLLLVVGGPECSYGWIVWEVKTGSGLTGWTPESDGEEFWLEPFPVWKACPNGPLSTLLKGERAVVAPYPDMANNLREKPNRDSAEVGEIFPGEVVKILAGPRCADGFVWWRVQALEGKEEGWTAEGKAGESWLLPYVKR